MIFQDCQLAVDFSPPDVHQVLYERIAKCQIEQEEFGQANDTIADLIKCLEKNKIARGKKQKIVSTLKNFLNAAILKQINTNVNNEKSEVHAFIPEDKRHPKFEAGLDCFDIIYTQEKGRHAVATRLVV